MRIDSRGGATEGGETVREREKKTTVSFLLFSLSSKERGGKKRTLQRSLCHDFLDVLYRVRELLGGRVVGGGFGDVLKPLGGPGNLGGRGNRLFCCCWSGKKGHQGRGRGRGRGRSRAEKRRRHHRRRRRRWRRRCSLSLSIFFAFHAFAFFFFAATEKEDELLNGERA